MRKEVKERVGIKERMLGVMEVTRGSPGRKVTRGSPGRKVAKIKAKAKVRRKVKAAKERLGHRPLGIKDALSVEDLTWLEIALTGPLLWLVWDIKYGKKEAKPAGVRIKALKVWGLLHRRGELQVEPST